MHRVCFFFLSLLFFVDAVAQSPDSIFVGSREGDPESIVKSVSAIHGDYSEQEVDLCIAGPDPLVVSRFYTSKDTLDIATFGGWRFQPQTFFLIRPNPDRSSFQTPKGNFECLDIYVGMPEGSLLKFSGFQNWENPEVRSKFFVDLEEDEVGICNTAKGPPSYWANAKNHVLHYEPKNKLFELHLNSGGKRIYVQGLSEGQFLLSKEVLPSGNRITYEYDQENRVKQIRMTNASGGKPISWVTFQYGFSILATASDGTSVEYSLGKDPSGALLLTEVNSSSFSKQNYQYQLRNTKALLTRIELQGGRYTEIDYEKVSPYRVTTLSEPVQEEAVSSTSFIYGKNCTEVRGPLDQKTCYSYNGENRLIAVEEFLDNALYRIQKKKWGERKDQGNLTSLSIEDGAGNTLCLKTFSYDSQGNILEENEYGNLTGQSPKPVTFDKKRLPESNQECLSKKYSYQKTPNENIISQINEQGNGTLLVYAPGTSILKRQEIHQNKVVKRRIFYEYNEDGALVCITTDNGNTRDPNDPDDVSQKFITLIAPKQEFPNMGAPEIVEERAYDSSSKTEILLKKTINHFDASGFIVKQDIYDQENSYLCRLEKNYDSAGRLISEKDPIGNQSIYVYDTIGNLIQEEQLDLTVHYDYDLQNNLIAVMRYGANCSPQKATFAFDAMGNKTLEIDTLGNRTDFHFDSLGRLTQKTSSKTEQNSKSTTWNYTYNLFDHPVVVTDPLNNTTTVEYNARGKPTHIAFDGKEESFVYSLEGSLYRHVNPQGITKRFKYDYLGRETKIDYYGWQSEGIYKSDCYDYDTFHLLSESSSSGRIKYIYNNKGELIRSIFAQNDGEITDFAYDSQGRLIETKKWKDNNHYTLYAQRYDLLGRIIEERIENEQGRLLHKQQFVYTTSGQLLSEIGFPNNRATILAEYAYDPLRRLSQVKRGSSTWGIIHQESQGVLKKTIRDPLGAIREELYNNAGLLLSHIQKDPQNAPLLDEQFTYDSLNNLTKEKTDNFEISYTHTPSGACQSIALIYNTPNSFWKSSYKQEVLQHTFTYNTYGELTDSNLPSFEKGVEYTYDAEGNLSYITYEENSKGQTEQYILTSDEKGNTIAIVQEDAFNLSKTYNTHDRILTEEVEDTWGSYGVSFKYDGEGCLTEITLPDESSIHYDYEGPFVSKIRRLSRENQEIYIYEVTDRDLMGNILQEILPKNLGVRKHIYDLQGRKVEITADFFSDKVTFDLLGNPIQKITKKGKEETKTLFTYDALSQLITENEHSYQYDSLQNLTLKDNVPYTTTPYNQVTKGGDFTCEYDECGNLKSLSDPLGTMKLQFDALGRLIFAQNPEGENIRYIYDTDFRRISKSIDDHNIERYFYFDGYELGAIDEHGHIKAVRIPLNPNSLESTSILSIELDNEVYIPFSDLQRNIRCLVNPKERNIVESYNFSAFGKEQISQPQLKNPWRFQSKRHDSETGLIYYGGRYYIPKLHKWISPDPIGSHDSLNLYLFCRNNPLKYYDPWGFASINEDCPCIYHDHPGYYNRPSDCACICGRRETGAKMSGVIVAIADFAVDTWNNPRFHGGLQALGGLAEISASPFLALSGPFTGGAGAALAGAAVMHGADHLITGAQTAFTSRPRHTVTSQMLQKTGMSPEIAQTTDSLIGITATFGGAAVFNAARASALPVYRLPSAVPAIQEMPISASYRIAAHGGKNSGFLRNNLQRSSGELQKGITSFEKQIALHRNKISCPENYVKNWSDIDVRQQQALVHRKWPSDVIRLEEQRNILRHILSESQ